jgi:hypothetical protein
MALTSKWRGYNAQIKELLIKHQNDNPKPLYSFYAKTLLNSKDGGHKNPDVEELARYIRRNEKTILDLHEGTYEATNNLDVANQNVKHLWIKHKGASLFVKNPNYVEEKEIDPLELQSKIIESLKDYIPRYPAIKRQRVAQKRLFVFSPADIHIGKLCSAFEVGEEYNSQTAVKRVLEGCHGLMSEIKENSIDKILFVIGNDILHIDNPRRTTTSGTPQDTDGMWYDNFLIAKQLYVDIIELMMGVADVHVVFNPSNHDYTNGFFLAQVIETHFKNCQNVTFDCSISHRKYFTYGNNIIGTTHGDGAKQQDLPMLMAHESSDWNKCKHRYFYIHHYHHKISKDYMSVCVEALRSPSGTDSWHHRNGYQHSPKAVEGFIHDFEHGQISRITHLF